MITRLFTDRSAGVSSGRFESFNLATHVGDLTENVLRNRSILEVKAAPLVFMNQVHGDTVVVVEGLVDREFTADAMITQEPGLALCVLVADCIPVLLWDDEGSCVAVAHVGRRGLMNGIIENVVAVMHELGAAGIKAELGPSICGDCYEVKEDLFDEVVAAHPKARSTSSRFDYALDLPAALAHVLERGGIEVVMSSVCTFESESHFSYRRDGITGRTAGVIWL